MNCHKCGHPAHEHGAIGCNVLNNKWDFCACKVPAEVLLEAERDAWKAEALAAREYIKMLEKYMGGFFGDEISITVDEMDSELEAYRAAKVEDTQP